MWSLLWIALGLYGWFNGYYHVWFPKEGEMPIHEGFLHPPRIIFLLCGAPKVLSLPKGVISFRSLFVQLEGILCVGYGVLHHFLPDQTLNIQMFVLFFAIVGVMGFTWLLYKHYPYNSA